MSSIVARRGWRRAAVGAVTLLASAGVIACGGSDSGGATGADGAAVTASESAELRKVNVVLPVPLGLFWAPYIVAAEKFYPEYGLEVDFPAVDGSASAAQAIATGNALAGSVSVRETYAAASKGGEVMSIAAFGRGMVNNISVPTDSPIRSLAELKGKALGVPSASDGSVALVKQLMEEAGLSPSDYDLPAVGAGGPAVAAALRSGRIAAYAHGLSDIAPLRAKSGIELRSLMPEKYQGLPSEGLVVARATMDDDVDRQAAINLARGYLQGAFFVADHPEEAKKIVCERVPRDCVDDDLVTATLAIVGERFRPAGGGQSGAFDYDRLKVLLDLTYGEELTVPLEEVFNAQYLAEINDGLEADTPGGS